MGSVGSSGRRQARVGLLVVLVATALLTVSCSAKRNVAGQHPATSPAPPTPTRSALVVGLGDSVMAGTACECSGPAHAFAQLMSRSLGRQITAVNLGVPGATTQSLGRQLHAPKVSSRVRRADVVLLIIGANDLVPELDRYQSTGCGSSCLDPAIHDMAARFNGLLDQIADERGGHRGTVLVADYWNVFRDGATEREEYGAAQIRWSRLASRTANAAICRVARENGAVCADTYVPFFAHSGDPDRYLASDGDHPNRAGVALIARQLQKATPANAF